MKRIFTIIILISITILLISCTMQNNSFSNSLKNTIKVKSSISKTKQIGISMDNIKQYLNTKKSDIEKIAGNEAEIDTTAILQSHMIFPFIFIKKLGLTFVFPNETDDLKPRYLIVDAETNVNNINLKGAKPGMSFKDIMHRVGNGKIKKSWISTEDDTAYRLDYKLAGMIFSFVSYEKSGENSELYIALN